jgi:L-amino acid N-acyltransferase YncA
MQVREALTSDVDAICAIYNHYVITSVATFDTEPQAAASRLQWLQQHNQENLPVLIVESSEGTIGWASLSYYHSRCAYKSTVEFSVYVDQRHHRKGVAKLLMNELLRIAEQGPFHCIVGLICSENAASLSMANDLGFETVGELREVGKKFDRWLNVTFVQRILSSSAL